MKAVPGTKFILPLVVCMVAPAALAAESVYGTALRQAKEGNCAAVVQTLAPLIQTSPPPAAPAYVLLSNCLAQTGRGADAEQTLRKGLSAHTAHPILQRALGELLMHQQFDSAEAGQLLGHAVEGAPQDPEARHFYAQWAFMNSRERVCAAQEQAALRLPGLNDAALFQMNTLLAMCSSHLEDATAGARAAFRRANEINLRQKAYDPVAAWQYVQFLGRVGEDADVQLIVNQILAHTPDFGPARLERAKHFDRLGQPGKAVDEARLVLKSAGNDFNTERAAHGILARSFVALGQAGDAALEQAWIESHPNPETPR